MLSIPGLVLLLQQDWASSVTHRTAMRGQSQAYTHTHTQKASYTTALSHWTFRCAYKKKMLTANMKSLH